MSVSWFILLVWYYFHSWKEKKNDYKYQRELKVIKINILIFITFPEFKSPQTWIQISHKLNLID